MSEETFLRDDLPNGEYADWLFDKLKACVAERDELRAVNERLKRLFKQRGTDAAEAEAEVERLREQRDSAEQCAGESGERAALAEGELNQLRRELRRWAQITEGIPDEVVERAWAAYTERLSVKGATQRESVRAALEAVWPSA